MKEQNADKPKSMTIHDLPVADRPRERLQRVGIGVLDHIIIGGKNYNSLKRLGLF
jgi:DNA repair protein RadC